MNRLWKMLPMALAMSIVATPVAAQEDLPDSVRQQVESGLEHFDAAEYDHAILEFRKAYEAHNEPRILYLLGRAHELNRDFAEAVTIYKQIIADGKADAEILAAARKGVAAYKDLLVEAKVGLTVTTNLDGAAVSVDGVSVGVGKKVSIQVAKGTRRVEVVADGYERFAQDLELESDLQVHAQLVAEVVDSTAGDAAQGGKDAGSPGGAATVVTNEGDGYATAGWVSVGVGGVLLGTGVGFNLLYNADIADASDAAARGDLAGYNRAIDASESKQSLSLAGYTLGAVGIVTGGVLLLMSGDSDGGGAAFAPVMESDFQGAVWYGRF